MVKLKKSFLERLTGSKQIAPENFESDAYSQPINNIYEEERAEIMLDPSPKMTMQEENFTSTNESGEGQLTIDVYQTDNDIVVKSTIAGVKPEDLDVSISNDMVTIRGERRKEELVEEENYYYQECYWGPFSRKVILPENIDIDSTTINPTI